MKILQQESVKIKKEIVKIEDQMYKYAKNFDLPLKFVIEDNNLSTNTPTDMAWSKKSEVPSDVIYYKYERLYPHHGTGSWVLF